MRKYRPSNGTEGMIFMDKFCDIISNTMAYDINDPEYPKEWIYNEKNEPVCTKWVKWDWDNDGNPDDEDNPKAPRPPTPYNQLDMFPLEIPVKKKLISVK